mmetsp:Transcript_108465/g.317326  ORF Transcript_108465/g.317326 Transcript_108465/m.317326 type:complete len:325 (+) Transcript_108465:56-1030(+)
MAPAACPTKIIRLGEESSLQTAASEPFERLPTLLGSSRPSPHDAAEVSEKRESGSKAHSSRGDLLGEAVQKVMSELGNDLLGVQVRVDSMEVDPLHGNIELHGLTVDNPEGFKSAYLLHADKVLLRIDMLKLITSLGSTVDVDEINLENVDVIYEETLTTSNIHTVIKKAPEGSEESERDDEGEAADEDATPCNRKGLALTLHKIRLRDLGAQVFASLAAKPGPRLALGDLECQGGSSARGAEAAEVAHLAFATLLKSILASIASKRRGDGLAQTAGQLWLSATAAVGQIFGCWGEGARRREDKEEPVEGAAPQVGGYPLRLSL